MSGGQHDQAPEVDLSVLNDDQRSGVTCINCGTPGGQMRPIVTPRNRQSTMVFVHADINLCLRRIARYVAELRAHGQHRRGRRRRTSSKMDLGEPS